MSQSHTETVILEAMKHQEKSFATEKKYTMVITCVYFRAYL